MIEHASSISPIGVTPKIGSRENPQPDDSAPTSLPSTYTGEPLMPCAIPDFTTRSVVRAREDGRALSAPAGQDADDLGVEGLDARAGEDTVHTRRRAGPDAATPAASWASNSGGGAANNASATSHERRSVRRRERHRAATIAKSSKAGEARRAPTRRALRP